MAAQQATERSRHVGRRAPKRRTDETRPGKIFLLTLVAAVPILFLFIVGPLLKPGTFPIQEYPTWRLLFLVGTPAAAVGALALYYRSPPWIRVQGAAKAGRTLGLMLVALWAVYSLLYLFLFVWGSPPGAAGG